MLPDYVETCKNLANLKEEKNSRPKKSLSYRLVMPSAIQLLNTAKLTFFVALLQVPP